MPDRDRKEDYDDGVLTQERTRVKRPRMYKVLLHNDDYTPMEFVVMVLESVFHKSNPEAVQIMLNVHKKGIGFMRSMSGLEDFSRDCYSVIKPRFTRSRRH